MFMRALGLATCLSLSLCFAQDPTCQTSSTLRTFEDAQKIFNLKNQDNNRLSPFWAVEYMGVDHMNDALEKVQGLKPVNIAIIDVGFDPRHFPKGRVTVDPNDLKKSYETNQSWAKFLSENNAFMNGPFIDGHGDAVLQHMVGSFPFGTSKTGVVTYVDAGPDESNIAGILKFLEGDGPRTINLSVSLFGAMKDALKDPIKRKNAIITYANNYDYEEQTFGDEREKDPREYYLTFTSLDAYGFLNPSMTESAAVDIAVPSRSQGGVDAELAEQFKDEWKNGRDVECYDRVSTMSAESFATVSCADGKNPTAFGGSSAGSPLAGGVITNVQAVLGDISIEELRVLLNGTGLQTLNAREKIRVNGDGTLNAFRLIKTAIRLNEKGWLENRATLIKDETIFNFEADAAVLERTASEFTAQEKWPEATRALRGAFLLSPTKERGTALARLYRKQGLTTNALFFESVVEDVEVFLSKIVQDKSIQHQDTRISAYRAAAKHNLVAIMREGLKTETAPEILEAIKEAVPYLSLENQKLFEAQK